MPIFAIDPGTTQSAYIVLDDKEAVVTMGLVDNHELLSLIDTDTRILNADHLAVEMVACYGMAVGREVFETALWTGRFIDRWVTKSGAKHSLIYRREEKIALCGTMKAKDPNIRQALLDRYGPGKEAAIGRKASPGPLYGIRKDIWAALAVAITWVEKQKET